MTNETKHTPTPWESGNSNSEVINLDHGHLRFSIKSGLTLIGNTFEKEDAAHIVKCVNIHDELVEALKKIANNEFKDADELWCSEAMAIFVARLNDIAADALKKAGAL